MSIMSMNQVIIWLICYIYALHGVDYTIYSSNNQFNCPAASINDTCIIYCDKKVSMRSFDCGNAGECYFYCHDNQCAQDGTLNATNSNNLYVYSSNDQCLAQTQVFVPNDGNAYIGIDNIDQKELKRMKIYSGCNTKSININCTGSTTESCREIEVYAKNSQYLEIVGYNQAIIESAIIKCPQNSSYNGPQSAPCIIDFSHDGIIKNTLFTTLNGIPTDIMIDASTMSGTITIQCTFGTSENDGLSFQNQGDCWITKSPTTDPTSDPTLDPTTEPTSNPTTKPTTNPTHSPTINPTPSPTNNPITSPTLSPTPSPTLTPTNNPITSPTMNPTPSPTLTPTNNPTAAPTDNPIFVFITGIPTQSPADNPSLSPTSRPSKQPTTSPSITIVSTVTDVVGIKENKSSSSSSSNTMGLDNGTLFQLYIVAVICCCNCALCCCFAIWCHFRKKQNEIQRVITSKQLTVESTTWNHNHIHTHSLNSVEMKPVESISPQSFSPPNTAMVHSDRKLSDQSSLAPKEITLNNRKEKHGEETDNDNDTKQEESEESESSTDTDDISLIMDDVTLMDKCNNNGSDVKSEGVDMTDNVLYDYMVNSPAPNYTISNSMSNNQWIPQHVISAANTYNKHEHHKQHTTMTDITLPTIPTDDR